jgi:hypothetical protein
MPVVKHKETGKIWLMRSPGYDKKDAKLLGGKLGDNKNPQQQQDGRITDLFCSKTRRHLIRVGDIMVYYFSASAHHNGKPNKV